MIKTIITITLATASALVLPQRAEASWADYSARRACHYIRQGYTPKKAGELGAYDTMKTSYRDAAVRAYDNGTMKTQFMTALLRTCPNTLAQ